MEGEQRLKFIVLGATGMAGHTISLYLQEQGHNVIAFTRRPFSFCENIIGDIFDLQLISDMVKQNNVDAVVNCVGILNKNAEDNKSHAVYVNSYFPHYLSYITQNSKTRIIHLSTDCVFSGKAGNYHENSLRDGKSFYDRSKALGELENEKDLTFRNSIIGPDMSQDGIGLFNWFMKQYGEINGFSKAIWTGVTTLTLAKAIEKATKDNITGLYNLVNNETISKYDMLCLFNKHFKNNKLLIIPNNDVILNKSLINNRSDFEFSVPSYEVMIKEMKNWIVTHNKLYQHYDLDFEGN